MLYMVECAFTDPKQEAAWNDYYSGRKLDEVLAVPGFRTSQRFKALAPAFSPYLAMHTVDSLDVLTGNSYRGGGGGSFDASFQPCITNWRRSLYSGLDRAPAIPTDALLAVCDEPDKAVGLPINFTWLESAGLDTSVARRGIALVSQPSAERVAAANPSVRLYAPMMSQRLEKPGKP